MVQERSNIRQGDISNFNILITPFVEQLDAANLVRDIFGQDLVGEVLDLNFAVLRHVCGSRRALIALTIRPLGIPQ